MRHQKMKHCAILLLCFGCCALQAQQAVGAGGGDAAGSGGSVAFTVGQAVYTPVSGATGSVLQGVQQPYEIFVVGTQEPGLDISLAVFPNPTSDNITLQVKDFKGEKLEYQLFDVQGKRIESKKITTDEMPLSLQHLPSATYFLCVMHRNKPLQTFKIIKNQ
ncbi:MAG: T9SS type A sorting domain-containing protein [Saprospiraceae bacterium]|nr:T9SS type A sorting domain-containing protein [Saprospiraceae bacterium]